MKRFLPLLFAAAALALTMSAPAQAADKDGGVPLPYLIPAMKGTKCVQPTEVMRRDHYEFLLRHREQTVHEGIRTKKYSLKACIQCHVPQEGTTAAAEAKGKGFFCQNCHLYAGVKVDCFECHSKKPVKDTAFHPMVTPGAVAMQAAERSNGASSAAMLNQAAGENTNTTGAAHE